MTDITSSFEKIQTEEVAYRSAVSEATLTKIGGAINGLIDGGTSKVGDIMASILTEAQFQAQRTTAWVLMDGRDVTGSDYETLTGFSAIPDARGEFLRGLDNGRGVDSGRTMGSSQGQSFGSHSHECLGVRHTDTLNNTLTGLGSGGNSLYYNASVPAPDKVFTNAQGGSETRPRNVAVNYFIKINN